MSRSLCSSLFKVELRMYRCSDLFVLVRMAESSRSLMRRWLCGRSLGRPENSELRVRSIMQSSAGNCFHRHCGYYDNVTVRGMQGCYSEISVVGRSDATKRPSVAAPNPRRYMRIQNDDGTYESVCPVCNRMLGLVRIELALTDLEDSHQCLEADILRLKPASAPFRATAELNQRKR